MKLYVITTNGKPMATNDRDERYLLCRSKAHALRTIKWLGLTGVRTREATDEEIANGLYSPVHGKRMGDTDRSGEVEDFVSGLINA